MAGKITTLIRFERAWMTGDKLDGVIRLASVGHIAIQKCEKNPDGDGYYITGWIDIDGKEKDRDVDDSADGTTNYRLVGG